jgi:hypothetical protein
MTLSFDVMTFGAPFVPTKLHVTLLGCANANRTASTPISVALSECAMSVRKQRASCVTHFTSELLFHSRDSWKDKPGAGDLALLEYHILLTFASSATAQARGCVQLARAAMARPARALFARATIRLYEMRRIELDYWRDDSGGTKSEEKTESNE